MFMTPQNSCWNLNPQGDGMQSGAFGSWLDPESPTVVAFVPFKRGPREQSKGTLPLVYGKERKKVIFEPGTAPYQTSDLLEPWSWVFQSLELLFESSPVCVILL